MSRDIFGQADDVLPVKALVLLEPFGAPFDREALTSLTMPVLLYRAEHSDLRPEGNIFALAAALLRPPRLESVPGGHLIFIDPCTPALVKEGPADCKDVAKDAAGVDRAAILRRVEAEVVDFLRNNLQTQTPCPRVECLLLTQPGPSVGSSLTSAA